MWIPTRIYERMPQFYIFIGLLFMSSGLYLGFDFKLTFVYLGTGIFCFVWGLRIFLTRLVHREAQGEQQLEAESAESN